MRFLGAARVRARAADDSGSALVLVLLIVLFSGVVMASVLDFTRGGLTIAPQARDLRDQNNYLQGAVDGAINSIRGSTTIGLVNGPACPTFRPPAAASSIQGAAGKVFSVSCTALPLTGVPAAIDQPDFALLALGTGSEGISMGESSQDDLLVDGSVYSHGVIAASSRTGMDVNGSVFAEGQCSGNLTSTDALFSIASNCAYSPSAGSSFGDDPQYLSALPNASALSTLIGPDSSVLGADPAPTCSAGYVTFSPGYYSETPAQLKSAYASNCSGTYVFTPGVYYFNYSGTWSVGQAIGGTRSGSTCDQKAPGVQFVFGGDSRISIGNGRLEICGPQPTQAFSGLPQRIAVYGLNANANNNTTTPSQQTTTLAATTAPTSTSNGSSTVSFSTPANAQLIGETAAALRSTANIDKRKHAALSYSAFADIPKGSTVESVKARLVYTLTGTAKATLTARAGSGTTATVVAPGSCMDSCLVDIPLSVLGGVAEWRSLNALTLDLDAAAGTSNPGTATVDGVELQVTYTPPVLETLVCPDDCDFFTSGNQSDVLIHGTVYTPNASWDVDLHGKATTTFGRGIVVRDIAASVSAPFRQFAGPFQVPSGTARGRLVLFRGSVGPDSAHLTELLRACVFYTDELKSPYTGGVRAGREVIVRRWSLLHSPSAENPDCH